MIMDLNKGNSQSTSWTDPITGEIYPAGDPHADIRSSSVVGASANYQNSFSDPLPPGAVPAQRMPQVQPMQQAQPIQTVYQNSGVTKFCEHCGSVLVQAAVICPTCGCQVAPLRQAQQQVQIQQFPTGQVPAQPQIQVNQVPGQPMQVIVNNNIVANRGAPKDKTVALLLCIFLGTYGAHRFYEGRIGTGILWLFTFGMFGIGWLVDVIRIASAPNPYYIK